MPMRPHIVILGLIGASSIAHRATADTITLTSTDPVSVADVGESTVVLDASPSGSPHVTGVTIDLDVTHHWLGDLVITLEHEGVTVRLIDRTSLSFMPFGCGGDDIAATFDDAATYDAEDLCWPGPGPTLAGQLRPVDALGDFVGLSAAGEWTVRVRDDSAFDAGTVNAVSVHIALSPPTECVGDVTGDDATNVSDFNILASYFGQSVTPNTDGDLNSDGQVNVADFNILAGDFGCAG